MGLGRGQPDAVFQHPGLCFLCPVTPWDPLALGTPLGGAWDPPVTPVTLVTPVTPWERPRPGE
eukprot:1642703-Prymnesium_polylepis.1